MCAAPFNAITYSQYHHLQAAKVPITELVFGILQVYWTIVIGNSRPMLSDCTGFHLLTIPIVSNFGEDRGSHHWLSGLSSTQVQTLDVTTVRSRRAYVGSSTYPTTLCVTWRRTFPTDYIIYQSIAIGSLTLHPLKSFSATHPLYWTTPYRGTFFTPALSSYQQHIHAS